MIQWLQFTFSKRPHMNPPTHNTMARYMVGLFFWGWTFNVVYGDVYDLRISEIMVNPLSPPDNNTRWIELYNSGSDTVALDGTISGFALMTSSSTKKSKHVLTTTHEIPPKGYAILGNNANRTTNGNVTVDVVVDNVLEILSADGSAENTVAIGEEYTPVDTFSWSDTSWNLFLSPGASIARISSLQGNAKGAQWHSSKVFIHGSSEDKGSPGRENPVPAILHADLRISELMIRPTAAIDPSTRWVELYNSGAKAVSLSGLVLKICGNTGCTSESLPTNDAIAPRSYVVVGNNGDRTTNGNVAVDVVLDNALDRWALDGDNHNSLVIRDETSEATFDELYWSTTETTFC
jgi:Lamin Tail Domain